MKQIIIRYIVYLILLVLIIGFVVWWSIAQWKECREAGFSRFYCLQHIS